MPPEWCWPIEEELGSWFEEVERRRKEKYGIDDDSSSPATDSSSMMSNDFAQGRR